MSAARGALATLAALLLFFAALALGSHHHGADGSSSETAPDACAMCQASRDAASSILAATPAPALEIGSLLDDSHVRLPLGSPLLATAGRGPPSPASLPSA